MKREIFVTWLLKTLKTQVWYQNCAIKAKNFFVHTSISQWKGRSPVWDLRCNFNLDALVNRFSHPSTGHAWGFSPLWVRMWDVKVPGAENTLLHPSISHLKGFRSAWCLLLCTFNLCAVGNVLSQPSYLHMWVSVRKCALTCVFKLYAVVKHLPHPSWVHCQNESHTMFFYHVHVLTNTDFSTCTSWVILLNDNSWASSATHQVRFFSSMTPGMPF